MDREKRTQSRLLINLLAVMLVLAGTIQLLNEVQNITAASLAALISPVIVITAMLLLRFRIVAFSVPDPDEDGNDDQSAPELGWIVRIVRRIAFLLAVISPALGASRYIAAVETLLMAVANTHPMVLANTGERPWPPSTPRGLRLSYARLRSARAAVGITPPRGALPFPRFGNQRAGFRNPRHPARHQLDYVIQIRHKSRDCKTICARRY